MVDESKSFLGLSLSEEALKQYLSSLYGGDVEICGVWRLGGEKTEAVKDLKGFGYGVPYVIKFKVRGEVKRVVLVMWRFAVSGGSAAKKPKPLKT